MAKRLSVLVADAGYGSEENYTLLEQKEDRRFCEVWHVR